MDSCLHLCGQRASINASYCLARHHSPSSFRHRVATVVFLTEEPLLTTKSSTLALGNKNALLHSSILVSAASRPQNERLSWLQSTKKMTGSLSWLSLPFGKESRDNVIRTVILLCAVRCLLIGTVWACRSDHTQLAEERTCCRIHLSTSPSPLTEMGQLV